MKAMLLDRILCVSETDKPLRYVDLPRPEIQADELLIRVAACGVCHTELDEIEGRTPPPCLPVIPGHQVVGRIVECGANIEEHQVGDRIGVAWIYAACGKCDFCLAGEENLCERFLATGRDVDGGYAEFMRVRPEFAFRIPDAFTDSEAAPLLCAGAIGYRSLRLTGLRNGQNLGLTGFGASAHLVLKMARYQFPDTDVYVFARREQEREFARELGAVWAGDTTDRTPEKLHAIIDTTPAWKTVVEALNNLRPGGRLVINAIRKEETDKDYLLKLDYPRQLWMEKEIKSVANVAKRDVSEFLDLATKIHIKPVVQEYSLAQANEALLELKEGHIQGAKVLKIG